MVVRISAPRGMCRIQDVFVRHLFPVDHKRRPELECIDDLFSVNFFLVDLRKFRSALVNMEIPVFIDQQHIQVVHDCIPEDSPLAEAVLAAFAFCMRIAEVPVDSQNGIHPFRHRASGCFDPPYKIGGIPGCRPQLAGALDCHKGIKAVYLAIFIRMGNPGVVQVRADRRIFIIKHLSCVRISAEIIIEQVLPEIRILKKSRIVPVRLLEGRTAAHINGKDPDLAIRQRRGKYSRQQDRHHQQCSQSFLHKRPPVSHPIIIPSCPRKSKLLECTQSGKYAIMD